MGSKYAQKVAKRGLGLTPEIDKITSLYKNRTIYLKDEAIQGLLKIGAKIEKDEGITTLIIKRNSLGNKNLGRVSFLKNYCGVCVLFID